MEEPTIPELHQRVSTLEEKQSDTSNAVRILQLSMVKLDSDVSTLREQLNRADVARDRQTDVLLNAIDDTKRRAMNQVPTWASTLITVLAMVCAALLTAHYG